MAADREDASLAPKMLPEWWFQAALRYLLRLETSGIGMNFKQSHSRLATSVAYHFF